MSASTCSLCKVGGHEKYECLPIKLFTLFPLAHVQRDHGLSANSCTMNVMDIADHPGIPVYLSIP